MARFCFNASRENSLIFLKKFYEKVDVDFDINNDYPAESCIILKNEKDTRLFNKLNERLAMIDGFSYPSYVPKWKSIQHKGPFLSQYQKKKYFKSKLFNGKKKYELSPFGERVAFLYASLLNLATRDKYILDPVFLKNFWNDFKKWVPEVDSIDKFNNLDWTDVVSKFKRSNKESNNNKQKYNYSLVQIDGVNYSMTPFAADEMNIHFGDINDPSRGRIKHAITPADITLNLSPEFKREISNISDFKNIVYKPGVKWAAKWTVPISGAIKYMDIIFDQPSNDDFIENFSEDFEDFGEDFGEDFSEDYSDDDDYDVESIDENDVSDYDDYDTDPADIGNDIDLDAEDLFGNIGELSDFEEDEDQNIKKPIARKTHSRPDDLEGTTIDFNNLDDEEIDLPYTYIVAPKTQWEYALDACKSKFKMVGNLGKVSNSNLKIIADAAAIALKNQTARCPEINQSFIQYAFQRNV